MEAFDVVVIGAGLAGLQCTRMLAGHGLRVLLVDRKQSLREAVHTTGIFVRRSLEDFELPAAFLGPPIRGVTLYSPSRRTLQFDSEHDEFRIGAMGPLYERLLKDCRAAGAEWLGGTTFVSCDATPTGSAVRLKTGGVEQVIETRYVFGADGANSRVARELGLSENTRSIVGIEEIYEAAESTGSPRLHCFLDRRIAPGYIAWIADDGQSVHVGVGGYPNKFQPSAALDRFRSTIGSVVGLRSARLVERRAGRIPVGGILPVLVNQRGLLVGDAAGAVSPLTAGGLDPCLRLSERAAKVAWRFLSSGDPVHLADYDGERFRQQHLARRLLRRAYDLAGYNTLLEIGCGLMRLPVGKQIARHIFFGRGRPDELAWAPAPRGAGGKLKLARGASR